jgi:hypothetical protein
MKKDGNSPVCVRTLIVCCLAPLSNSFSQLAWTARSLWSVTSYIVEAEIKRPLYVHAMTMTSPKSVSPMEMGRFNTVFANLKKMKKPSKKIHNNKNSSGSTSLSMAAG